jgi:hypothetical protein
MILVCCEHPIQDTLGFLGPPYILTGIPELLVFFPNNYSRLQIFRYQLCRGDDIVMELLSTLLLRP